MAFLNGVLIALLILVCISLVGVILLQRSEGGALGVGGGPSGFMTARGAGNLLTRITAVLGALFFGLSLTITLLHGGRTASSVTDRVDIRSVDPTNLGPAAPVGAAPAGPGLPGAPAAGGIQAPRPTIQAPLPVEPAQSAPAQPAPAQ